MLLERLRATGTDAEIRVSTESRPWRRKFSRRSCRDSNPRPFNHVSGALTTELSPPQKSLATKRESNPRQYCAWLFSRTYALPAELSLPLKTDETLHLFCCFSVCFREKTERSALVSSRNSFVCHVRHCQHRETDYYTQHKK